MERHGAEKYLSLPWTQLMLATLRARLEFIAFRTPPTALFHPRIAWQVLRRIIAGPRADT